jgi:hypothetical protein
MEEGREMRRYLADLDMVAGLPESYGVKESYRRARQAGMKHWWMESWESGLE